MAVIASIKRKRYYAAFADCDLVEQSVTIIPRQRRKSVVDYAFPELHPEVGGRHLVLVASQIHTQVKVNITYINPILCEGGGGKNAFTPIISLIAHKPT